MSEETIRSAVRTAIEKTTVKRTAAALGLSSEATLRLAGNFAVQDGTLALAERNLPNLTTR